MPSKLRLELDFTVLPPVPVTPKSFTPVSTPKKPTSNDLRKQAAKMSLTQTYRIASAARNKLGQEALRPDHDLRLLVGHANLLDSLMLDLANAERQQEAWFNSTLRKASAKPAAAQQSKHVKWMDTVAEAEESIEDDEYETTESESESEDDDEDELLFETDSFPSVSMTSRRRRSVSPPPPARTASSIYDDLDDDAQIDDDELSEEHALVRVASNATTSSTSSASSTSSDIPESEAVPALEYEIESDEDSPLPSPMKEYNGFFPASKKARTEQMAAAADLVRAHLAQPVLVV